jgi:RNA polymerase sigma-70 factor (ECF subfamily)
MSVFFSYKNSKYSNKTDKELVGLYKNTVDTKIIGEFYNRYSHIVFGIAMKYMKDTDKAQDILLDVFHDVFENLLKYSVDDFKNWLLTITRNLCFKRIKDNEKIISLDYTGINNLSVNFMEKEAEFSHHIEKEKQYSNLKKALLQLKKEQKECVTLFYLQDKSYVEISNITGYPVKKVKSYIQNGKRNLSIIMNKLNK